MGQPDESSDYLRQPAAIASQQEIASVQGKVEKQMIASQQEIAEAVKRTLRGARLLGELGWTISMEMPWPEFQSLATQDDLTVERANEWFVNYYTEDNASEFKRLAEGLLSSRQLALWKLLIKQCVRAFGKGDFAICVPSLLLIFEGSIAKPWRVTFENRRSRHVFFESKISASASGSITEYKWRSVAAFAAKVFRNRPPDHDLHRHLILHGKSDPAKWDRAYCLRLFQAISTVASLAKEILAVQVERDRKRS
jgi:hypothetical protein